MQSLHSHVAMQSRNIRGSRCLLPLCFSSFSIPEWSFASWIDWFWLSNHSRRYTRDRPSPTFPYPIAPSRWRTSFPMLGGISKTGGCVDRPRKARIPPRATARSLNLIALSFSAVPRGAHRLRRRATPIAIGFAFRPTWWRTPAREPPSTVNRGATRFSTPIKFTVHWIGNLRLPSPPLSFMTVCGLRKVVSESHVDNKKNQDWDVYI